MERDEPRPRSGPNANSFPRRDRSDFGLYLALAALVGTAALGGLVVGLGSPDTAVAAMAILGIVLALCALILGRTLRAYAMTKQQLVALEAQRNVDALTGLSRFDDFVAGVDDRAEVSRGVTVGLLLCDLDRLHVVNAADGHPVGDDLVRIAANRLRAELDGQHRLVRFHGDRFVIITQDLPTERDLELLAERVLAAVGHSVTTTSGLVRALTMSVGIASGVVVGQEAEGTLLDLIGEAEIACRRASAAGGGQWLVFRPAYRAELLAPAQLCIELREAVDQNQFEVHYQPIVDARTGMVDRLEALVRWRHPVRRLVLPGAFLGVAADSDLIHEIGEYVLDSACRQAVEWSDRLGRPIVVSVNLDTKQLLDPMLPSVIGETLAATGLPPGQLELEIGEGIIEGHHHAALVALGQLEWLKIRLALDGAGVGAATLENLAALPMLSTVKLSPSIAETMAKTPLDLGVAGPLAAQASDQGVDVVIVGLEQAEQVAGAMAGSESSMSIPAKRLLQGFALNRPAPPDRLEQILTDGCPLVRDIVEARTASS